MGTGPLLGRTPLSKLEDGISTSLGSSTNYCFPRRRRAGSGAWDQPLGQWVPFFVTSGRFFHLYPV